MTRFPRFPVADVPAKFGERLRAERDARRWTQARLATKAGLKREAVSRLERGERSPRSDTVFRLEHALDLNPGTLVPSWAEWSPTVSTAQGPASRRRRRELKLSIDRVAAAAGVSPATLSRFERQERATPSLLAVKRTELDTEFATLINDKLARALGFADASEHDDWCSGD